MIILKRKLYIAYGSNMDEENMDYRCADATLVGTSKVYGYRLLFKGSQSGFYATIEKDEGSYVPVLIWEISDEDERHLDFYEGYPRFYYKKNLRVEIKGKKRWAMVYIMDEKRKLGHPKSYYYGLLDKAYDRFGFDKKILRKALVDSKPTGGAEYV